jgi:hypothetical protein
MIKTLRECLDYLRDLSLGVDAGDRYDIMDSASDNPIYDQLEREWAKSGRLPLTLGSH